MAKSIAADSADDTLKRRARRRLIGAVALVLAAVIALPMIFDDEKRPLDQDVSIQIPSQDAQIVKPAAAPSAVKPKTVEPREPGSTEKPKSDALPAPAVSTPSPPAAPAAKSEAGASRDTDRPAGKPPAADSKAASSTARAEPTTEKHESQAKPAPKESVSKGEEARVQAILDAKPAKTGGFAVQIGAFAADEKVREARDKLSGAGFASYTEKLETRDGERTRVRAGPFASREAAEAARERIRTLGFSGANVVAK